VTDLDRLAQWSAVNPRDNPLCPTCDILPTCLGYCASLRRGIKEPRTHVRPKNSTIGSAHAGYITLPRLPADSQGSIDSSGALRTQMEVLGVISVKNPPSTLLASDSCDILRCLMAYELKPLDIQNYTPSRTSEGLHTSDRIGTASKILMMT